MEKDVLEKRETLRARLGHSEEGGLVVELCEELLMRDVGWRRRRRATSFRQKAASSPCVRYNTTTITHSTNITTTIQYIWKQTISFGFPSSQNFMIVQYQKFCPIVFLDPANS